MTTGVLIFAFNNEATDYVSMAAWSAKRIRNYLDIPVAVVTNNPDVQGFDKVIVAQADSGGSRFFEDYETHVTWYNASRVNAFDLSPWDQTLLLDADFVVNSTNLNTILKSPQDFMAHNCAYNINGRNMAEHNYYGRNRLPMWWATVIMFRRTNFAQYVFSMMELIRNNWSHYRDLYGINRSTYRNDYALSIALQVVNGCHTHVTNIPWPLATVMPNDNLSLAKVTWAAQVIPDTGQTVYSVFHTPQDGLKRQFYFDSIDFHAMGKRDLERIIEAH